MTFFKLVLLCALALGSATASKYPPLVASSASQDLSYISNQLSSSEPESASSYAMGAAESLYEMPNYLQSGPSYQSSGGVNVPAAIQTKRTVEVKPISFHQDPVEPHIVDVEASYQPVHVVFRSSSSPVMIQQIHTPSKPMQLESTQSEDEPHRVQHQVMRPVIQEVREIIQPYRRVLQEVRPVLEEVRTIVAKSEGSGRGGAGGHGGGGESHMLAHGGAGAYGAGGGGYGGGSSAGGYGGGSGAQGGDVGYASSNAEPVAAPINRRVGSRKTRRSHNLRSRH